MAQLLVNACHVKTVLGRKTDVKDCEWIAQLMHYRLLRGSFVPLPHVRQWRNVIRHRIKVMGQRTAVANWIHKVLEDAKVKLSSVVSEIMGVAGLQMLRTMVAGESNTTVLSQPGNPKIRTSHEALQESLQGKLTAHHCFMLEGLLEQVAFLIERRCYYDLGGNYFDQ